jgi:hypothetical protein
VHNPISGEQFLNRRSVALVPHLLKPAFYNLRVGMFRRSGTGRQRMERTRGGIGNGGHAQIRARSASPFKAKVSLNFSQLASTTFFTKKCPLVSAHVRPCPLMSHSKPLTGRTAKNPCYNPRMRNKCASNASVPTCRDCIAGLQPADRPYDTGQNETFETETAPVTPVLFGNERTFLRPVSFCPVPPGPNLTHNLNPNQRSLSQLSAFVVSPPTNNPDRSDPLARITN